MGRFQLDVRGRVLWQLDHAIELGLRTAGRDEELHHGAGAIEGFTVVGPVIGVEATDGLDLVGLAGFGHEDHFGGLEYGAPSEGGAIVGAVRIGADVEFIEVAESICVGVGEHGVCAGGVFHLVIHAVEVGVFEAIVGRDAAELGDFPVVGQAVVIGIAGEGSAGEFGDGGLEEVGGVEGVVDTEATVFLDHFIVPEGTALGLGIGVGGGDRGAAVGRQEESQLVEEALDFGLGTFDDTVAVVVLALDGIEAFDFAMAF
ncbi:MAG: hypothetical protein RI897_1883 [Verrucomicrobiota bacterium]